MAWSRCTMRTLSRVRRRSGPTRSADSRPRHFAPAAAAHRWSGPAAGFHKHGWPPCRTTRVGAHRVRTSAALRLRPPQIPCPSSSEAGQSSCPRALLAHYSGTTPADLRRRSMIQANPTELTPDWGMTSIPLSDTPANFFVMGGIGSGKDISLRLLMQSALRNIGTILDHRALVFDAKGNMQSLLCGWTSAARFIFSILSIEGGPPGTSLPTLPLHPRHRTWHRRSSPRTTDPPNRSSRMPPDNCSRLPA